MTDPRITEATSKLADAISMLHHSERHLLTLAYFTASSAVRLLKELHEEYMRTRQVEREVTAPEKEAA